MKRKSTAFARRYQVGLRKCLARQDGANPDSAHVLGRQAVSIGLGTLTLAGIHEDAVLKVASDYSAGARAGILRRAGSFFADAITPLEKNHRTAREASAHLSRLNATLRHRAVELAVADRRLKEQVVKRKTAEEALQKSKRHYGELLQQSRKMHEQLRHLSHQLLFAQEEERKTISRELHDQIAQTLTGINVQLAALKAAATLNTRDLQRRISNTQRLVEKSVQIVHQFARELRPSVLDDLGLIPALHSFVKTFARQFNLRVSLKVFAGVEQLDSARRTVLYRVAQESLTNVARHARATDVHIAIEELPQAIGMQIHDNGKSFPVERMLHARKTHRLGLLGMRERVEMVGGRFNVESAPTMGTTVSVQIPFRTRAAADIRTHSFRAPDHL